MTQEEATVSTSETQTTNELLLEIINLLKHINISLQQNNSSPRSSGSRPPIVEFPTTTTDSTPPAIGDRVVINHRYRNQYGIQGTVFHTSPFFIWLRTDSGEEYKKSRKYILRVVPE